MSIRVVHESGLCLTRNWPDGIRWQKISPVADRRSRRVGRIRPSTGGGRVGQRHRSKKMVRKLREKPRFGKNLIGIWEILLDSVKISPDLREISLESRFFPLRFGIFSLGFVFYFIGIWNFFSRIWVSCLNLGFSTVGLGFSGFGGRETEINSPELVFGGEDSSSTAGVVRSVGVGTVPVGFFG